MNAPTKRQRPAGHTFYITVLSLSAVAALSFLNRWRAVVEPPHQIQGRALLSPRDQEVLKSDCTCTINNVNRSVVSPRTQVS
jgi:hypothetical protein